MKCVLPISCVKHGADRLFPFVCLRVILSFEGEALWGRNSIFLCLRVIFRYVCISPATRHDVLISLGSMLCFFSDIEFFIYRRSVSSVVQSTLNILTIVVTISSLANVYFTWSCYHYCFMWVFFLG